jgi:hypothetical protein
MFEVHITKVRDPGSPATLYGIADAMYDLDKSMGKQAGVNYVEKAKAFLTSWQESDYNWLSIGQTDDPALGIFVTEQLAARDIGAHHIALPVKPALTQVPELPVSPYVPHTVAALLLMTEGNPLLACQHASVLLRSTGERKFYTDVLTELRTLFPWVIKGMQENDIPYDGGS